MGNITVDESFYNILAGIDDPVIQSRIIAFVKQVKIEDNYDLCAVRFAKPIEFYEAIGKAKQNNDYGAFVEQRTIEEYSKMKYLFLTLDGSAGIAVTSDNDIVSLFNGGKVRNVMKTLIPLAIAVGGEKLDSYDSNRLSIMYEGYGFYPVSSVRFSIRFAPKDWNYQRDGRPDILFWIHNNDSPAEVVKNMNGYLVDRSRIRRCSMYTMARSVRDKVIFYNKKY